MLSRGWSLFLVAVGVFNWLIWPRFSVAIWDDARAWSGAVGHSNPTSFLLVHAVLVLTAVATSTVVGILGIRGYLACRGLTRDTVEPVRLGAAAQAARRGKGSG
jgi:hypothetical protein